MLAPQYGRYIRSALRQEKGLSAIADLLTNDSERVVKAASGALRNLAVDSRNKELIGEGCRGAPACPPNPPGMGRSFLWVGWLSVRTVAALCWAVAPLPEQPAHQNSFLTPRCPFPCLLTPSYFPFAGKHAIPSLVKNLPGGQQTPAKNLSEDTVVSILNTINEVIAENLEAAKKLRETQGIEKLVLINKTGYALPEGRRGGREGLLQGPRGRGCSNLSSSASS